VEPYLTIGGSYFEGVCASCEEPEKGGTVVIVHLGTLDIPLCPAHYNALHARITRFGTARDL
jgi:hypothetical protein